MNKDALIQLFEKRTGYAPDLENPKTYCEKALWTKLYVEDIRMVSVGSKIGAKGAVSGSKITPIPTLDINPSFPPYYPVMVRLNHYSGISRVVHNKKEWRKLLSQIPNKPYGVEKGEWHYQHMSPDILIEPVIADFMEIKFFCFGGKIRYGYEVRPGAKTFFTGNGTPLDISQQVGTKKYSPDTSADLYIPNSWVWEEVEKLAEGFPHVRIDLMMTKEQAYLSEFTFFHFSGMLKFEPKSFDYELGKWWQIEA